MPWIGDQDDTQIEKGHPACAGCGMVLGVRHMLQEAGEDTILVIPACCASVIQGVYPYTAFDVPIINTGFAAAASTASGVEMALKQRDEETNVIVLAGDGGTTDIGLAAMSGALERRHNFMYVQYDNEAYSNTGFQKSGRTPTGARTTTTPTGREGEQKDVDKIVEAHDPEYMATTTPGYVQDLREKTARGLEVDGPSYMHMLTPCPPGWRFDNGKTVEISKLAVSSGLWVLYEKERGKEIEISRPSKSAFSDPERVDDYVEMQDRFATAMDEDIESLQRQAERNIEEYSQYLEEEVTA
ncbi:MAG: pyruvate ferredoxin oxidoreductase beta subunit [Natronomonas sp.]|jgi:pyruvate ferredoxin oxidoreductase beta subunit